MESRDPRDPFDGLWMAALLMAAPLVAWWAWSEVWVTWAFQLKRVELKLLHALGLGTAQTADLSTALQSALTAPDKIAFDAFFFGLEAVGSYLSGPVAAGLVGLGIWLIGFHPAGQFRRRFDLWRLAEAMREPWPFALHALRRGHLALPLDHPVWGMALSGEAFLRRHDSVIVEEVDGKGWTLREESARTLLAAQLGPPWVAAESLPLHIQALAGLFALRISSFTAPSDAETQRLKNHAFALLRSLALSAANHKAGDYLPTAATYQEILRETALFLKAAPIQAVIAGHAYSHTVLLRLLAEARSGGVLPSASFNWLKGVDRPLWYALSSLGRRAPFVEALGAIAHYQAELRAGVALYPPAMEAALDGLWLEVQRLPLKTATSPKTTV
jgi:intracellular multiplication protein IcmP